VIIPLDPVRQYTGQSVSEPTAVRIYPGANGAFTLYDDDGQTLGYRDGSDSKTTWIQFTWDDRARRLTIEPDSRMKKWPGGTRMFVAESERKNQQSKVVEIPWSASKCGPVKITLMQRSIE
jgi:alpha-glucosidase (family GH31 glycosyl hydrolase)